MAADVSLSPIEKPPPGPVQRMFFNDAELRAGWRLVIFLLVMMAVSLGIGFVVHVVRVRRSPPPIPMFDVLVAASIIFITTAVMAIIEKRELADYGLPLRQCLGKRFWLGAAFGLVTMTAVVAAMHVAGVIWFSPGTADHGQQLATYATFAALTFMFGAVFEELTCRGYLLFTLTTGIGFWPAALISSTIFGLLHAGNTGETAFGCFSTGVFGFLFCVLLRRTGNLWMPIGFHAAYNWAESFFYGTIDSGYAAHDRFLTANVSGSHWLTGGPAGPEGSVLCVAIIVLLTIGCGFGLRGAKFPDVAALKTRRPPTPEPAPQSDLPPVTT